MLRSGLTLGGTPHRYCGEIEHVPVLGPTMAPVRFSISTAFLPTDQLVPIAKAADELGYDSLAMPDHVVDLETLRTPYPYTPDGARRWGPEAEWPDPWVLAGALSTVTTRLRFFTSVYVPALRNPFQVAKSVGTAAVISGNRVALGVGIGWCEEEFELLGAELPDPREAHRRGARADQGAVAARVARVPRRVLRRTAAGDGADPDRAGADLRRRPLRDRLRAGGAARRLGRRHVPDRGGDRLGHPAGRGTRRAGRRGRLLGVRRAHRRVPARALRPGRGAAASPTA